MWVADRSPQPLQSSGTCVDQEASYSATDSIYKMLLICSRPNLWPIELHSNMEEIHSGLNLHGEGHSRFSNSYFRKLLTKVYTLMAAEWFYFLNSKTGHATSTHMSAGSSVLTGMNASACLPGIGEGGFPSPKALTDAHLPCSLSNTQGQTQPQCEWDNNAVAWLPHMSYITDLTYPTQSHVGCVTGPKSGMGLC